MAYHASYWILGVAYVFALKSALGRALGSPVRPLSEQLITQVKAGIYYLFLVIAPDDLSIEHQFVSATNGSVAAIALSGIVTILLLVGIARTSWPWKLTLSWALLALLPSVLVPLNVLVNEHRLYLPLALVGGGFGVWLQGQRKPDRRWVVFLVAGAGIFALLANQRNDAWRNELSLWRDAVAKGPRMYRSQMHLGGALEKAGRETEALERYRKASLLASEVSEVHYNLGNAYRKLGRGEEVMS